MYIWERKNWPHFTWDDSALSPILAQARLAQGKLLGRMSTLGFDLKQEATLKTLTQDVVQTSAIEQEILPPLSVRSSVARRMGIKIDANMRPDQHVEGIVSITLDATRKFDHPLTRKRLMGWHASLFPTGFSGLNKITVSQWRSDKKGPMQVVSGPAGREKVHYEAPPARQLNHELKTYLDWFNSPGKTDLFLTAGLAHYWFVVIHPFDDGNGRIARALSDMLLARSEKSPHRYYSVSNQILKQQKEYYAILERSSKGLLDITPWMEWFLHCLSKAIQSSEATLDSILAKAKFWEKHAGETFNQRQSQMINRLMDDFKGNCTSSKWAKMNKCSPDTALRDINDLVRRGILKKASSGGRSTHYKLKF